MVRLDWLDVCLGGGVMGCLVVGCLVVTCLVVGFSVGCLVVGFLVVISFLIVISSSGSFFSSVGPLVDSSSKLHSPGIILISYLLLHLHLSIFTVSAL